MRGKLESFAVQHPVAHAVGLWQDPVMRPIRARLATLVAVTIVAIVVVAPRPGLADPPSAPAAAAPASSAPHFDGDYRYVGDARERAALEQAIVDAAAPLIFFERPFARSHLREHLAPPARMTIRIAAGSIEVTMGGQPMRSPEQGSVAILTSPRGHPIRVMQRVDAERLIQTVVTEDAEHRNVFALSADGATLVVQLSLTSRRLPRPVVYRLTFRRA